MITSSLRLGAACALVLALSLSAAPAQQSTERAAPQQRANTSGVLGMLPADVTTEHVLDTGGEKLAYTATAGTLSLMDQNGERSAAIFYTAYVLKGASAQSRPLTFVFNGGPGAASTYLHLGLAGPQVIDFGPERDGAAARLGPNPDAWLKFTDLVMIDPVGAGWSRAAKSDNTKDFWGVDADANAFAKTIALYLAQNGRHASPKYLLGESYGGFRAAKLARALQREQGIFVSGIVMVSPYLDGSLAANAQRSARAAALRLPSMAAATLDANGRFTPEALEEAERFAMTDYLVTLAGKPPTGETARAFYARVAAVTGLPVDLVTRWRGFVRDFTKHARTAQGEVVSSYDGSLAVPDAYPESLSEEAGDPSLDGFTRALASMFVAYARDTLGFKTDMTYTLLSNEASGRWDWGRGGRSRASVADDLRELLALNPRLSVLIAHGRSDLVTPYGATRYLLDHLPPIGKPDRAALKVYKGGHMFYFDPLMRAAFTADVQAFYQRAGM